MRASYDEIQEMYEKLLNRQKRRRWIWGVLLAAAAGLAVWVFMVSDNDHFGITYYTVSSPKIGEGIRAVLISDLHNKEFGPGNRELVDAVEELEPDLILLAGDLVNGDSPDISVAASFCEKLNEVAPVFYGLGNNEGELMYGHGEDIRLMQYMNADGIPFLYNSSVSVEIKGNKLEIGAGTGSDKEFDEYCTQFIEEYEQKDGFKLLINHIPTAFYNKLYDADFDLAVAGHFHGGLIRIPIVGGLYHLDTGFFPKYCFGEFQLGKGKLIVTRGMGNNEVIPRINNEPELVVIDIVNG